MDAERIKLAEAVLDMVGDMNTEAAEYRRRMDELAERDLLLPSYFMLSKTYSQFLTLHCKLVCGFTRSKYRNKTIRKWGIEINAGIIAKETGASVEEVESYLLARLDWLL